MSVFTSKIPDKAPVIVVICTQPGCGACDEYEPVFAKVAGPYVQRGLPIIQLDVNTPEPNAQAFMNYHGIDGTPTVIAATLYRGALGRIDGPANETETRALLDLAWAHNRPWSPW